MNIDLPSASYMARFMPTKSELDPDPQRQLPKLVAWFESYLGKLRVGQRFTMAEAAEKCGYGPKNVRVAISNALRRGLIERIVYVPGQMQIQWRRNGVHMDVCGVQQLGVDRIEAMPEGRVFCQRQLRNNMSNTSAHRAIRVANDLGLIEVVGRVERPETTYRKTKP